MKIFFPMLMILVISSCKKEDVNPNQIKEFTIQSAFANASYTIKVALPQNYNPSEQKYAAVYVLDGEDNFSFVSNECQKQSNDYSKSNVLVVSIGYGNDRSLDYTPSKADEGGGGAENFMKFIKEELIPKMESEYAVDTLRKNRVILGHSFGGLLAAYAFTNYNEVFGNYLMLSPSIWYDNEILLKLEKESRAINKANLDLVYMGLGQMEGNGRMLSPFLAFHQQLKNNYSGMNIISHIEPHLDHMGSKNPNIVEGLKFYFQNK